MYTFRGAKRRAKEACKQGFNQYRLSSYVYIHSITYTRTSSNHKLYSEPPKIAVPPAPTPAAVVDFESADSGPVGGYTGFVVVRFVTDSRRAVAGAYNISLDGTTPQCVAGGVPPPTSVC